MRGNAARRSPPVLGGTPRRWLAGAGPRRDRAADHVTSGFESEIDAEAAGWKYLNDVTEGTWRDPRRGQMLLRTYIDKRWWAAQRLALNTRAVEQVAEMLHIGRDKVYCLLRTGPLRSMKIGKLRRITDRHLAEFVAWLETPPRHRDGRHSVGPAR